jgi:hypothetical protein
MFSLFPLLCYYFPPFSPRSLENLACVWKFSPLGCLPATEKKEKKDRKQNLSPAIIIFMLLCVFLFCYILDDAAAALRLCWVALSLARSRRLLVLVAHVQLLFLLLLELFILRYFAPYGGEQVAGAAASVFVPPSFGGKIV